MLVGPLCYSTTQPLYQGAGMPGKKARRVASQVKLHVSLECKVVDSSLEENVASFASFPR